MEAKNVTLGVTGFAEGRHTPQSGFSYFTESWAELLELVRKHWDSATPGYKDGVVKVSVPPELFVSGLVRVGEFTDLRATFAARRNGEAPFLSVTGAGDASKTLRVEVILYSHDLLAADGDNAGDSDYEVVSINASPYASETPEPMNPIAMARNFLGQNGGTKATYTAEQFAEAIDFWSRHCMRTPEP